MKRNEASLPSGVIEYDPGDAVGFPAEMTLEEAVSYWRHDMAYLQTLLDTKVISHVKKWPAIRRDGQEVPSSQICEMAGLQS